MESTLSRNESFTLLSLSIISIAVLAKCFQGDGEPVVASLAFSCLAFSSTYSLIRWLGPTFIKANLKGKDMSKIRKIEMSVLGYPLASLGLDLFVF